ncbi:CG43968, partial [Drosophila busckii]
KCDDDKTITRLGTAYWKYRNVRYTTSEDVLCFMENGKLLIRECNTITGEWKPEFPVCSVAEPTNKFCPEELFEISDDRTKPICLKLSTQPQKYNDSFCYGSNLIIPFDLSQQQSVRISEFLLKKNIMQFWLPLVRDSNSSPYKIRLPGKHWGHPLDDKQQIKHFKFDKKCVASRNKKGQSEAFNIAMTDCNELLYSICAFDGNFVTSSGCPNGFGALSYRPNECYGVDWRNNLVRPAQKVNIREYFHQRNALNLVLNHFVPNENKYDYFEVDSFKDPAGDEYAIEMNKKEMLRVTKKKIPSQTFELSKVALQSQKNTPQLILKFDSNLDELVLIIYNSDYLWRIDEKDVGVQCFTNGDYDLVRSTKINHIWENKKRDKSIYKLKMVGVGPSEYWCEGHTIFNFMLVRSQRIIASRETRGHLFATRLNVTCMNDADTYFNVFKTKYIKQITKSFHNTLRNNIKMKSLFKDLVIHNTRIMSIEQFADGYIDCWMHITASLKNSAVDNSEEKSSEENNNIDYEYRIRHDTSVRMRIWSQLNVLISDISTSNSALVRSIEYCFPNQFVYNKKIYQWAQALRGQQATLSSLCLQNNGMPYSRQCIGDFTRGAFWQAVNQKVFCHPEQEIANVTKILYSLESSKLIKISPEKVVRKVRNILEENAKNMLPADIHFTANIVQASVQNLEHHVIGSAAYSRNAIILKETACDLMAIYNSLVRANESTINMSAKLNSTNVFLEVIENAMDTFSSKTVFNMSNVNETTDVLHASSNLDVLDYDDIGVSVKISPNLLYFTINPFIANVSGIAIYKNINTIEESNLLKGGFKDEHFRFVQSNHNLEDFIFEPNFQFGTYAPESLLTQWNKMSLSLNATKGSINLIVIKIYSNDKLFREQGQPTEQRSALGRIVSISFPGRTAQLPVDLPLAFRISENHIKKSNVQIEFCKYWNFNSWASDGIKVSHSVANSTDVVLCQVSHLTPFAYLVGFNFTVDDDIEVNVRQRHDQALDIITLTGCSLSLLGISGIFITAAMFQSW